MFRLSFAKREIHTVFFLFVAILSTITCQMNSRVVTPLGEMEGVEEIIRHEKVYQFRNIPYAQPPTGHLRLSKPIPFGSWSGVLNATKFGPSCMQPSYRNYVYDKYKPNLDMSEDCLSLNVYVARNISANANRSVMVWIHGGSYLIGQGSLYDGSYLALTGDVVVVTLNYRLGPFGFTVSPTNGISGNYGLWDQRLALEWVQSNIASFGGNPNSVTIFGQSAGGFSVSLHAIIPDNKGLFHRVIAQSGSSEGPLAIWHSAAYTSEAMIRLLDCQNNTIKCIRSRSASEIVNYTRVLSSPLFLKDFFEIPSGPVVDHDFLYMDPTRLLMNKTSPNYRFFRSLDYMTGNVDTEGSISVDIIGLYAKLYGVLSNGISLTTFCEYYLPGLTTYYFGKVNDSISSDFLCSLYGSSGQTNQMNNAMNSYADANFIAPAVKSLIVHSKDNYLTNSFQFLFRRPCIDPAIRHKYDLWTNGSTHGSDNAYLFGLEDYQDRYNITVRSTDISLSNTMMRYWTNFAKTGNPNSDDLPRWDAYDEVRQTYVNLDTSITQDQHLYQSRVDIWLKKLPDLIQHHLPDIVIGK
ncbi:acetylcholinesterase-like [Ylistrum balloti]|uniref:acetylcholinesterase-like n=1 Tax=Ylistrum balloti TaxID=509963 RepID=UPI002905ECE3|nr:acetylcholinesterase-like [Ylistrum balloti]